MKIAVIGDIHGNLLALEAVMADLKLQGINRIYCVGDLVGYGPKPNEVIELIKNQNVFSILGNYDDAVAFHLPVCGCNYKSEDERKRGEASLAWTIKNLSEENKLFLQKLPEEISETINELNILIFHGSPRANNEYLYEVDDEDFYRDIIKEYPADIYIYGHTHIPYVKKIDNHIFVNAGSVGMPKDGNPKACYATIEINNPTIDSVRADFRRVNYAIDLVVVDINSVGLPEEFGYIIKNGLNYKSS